MPESLDLNSVLSVLGIVLAVLALPWITQWIDRRRTAVRSRKRRMLTGSPPSTAPAVDRRCWHRLYRHAGSWARAIRLVGADAQLIPVNRLEVSYTHAPLMIPPELLRSRDLVLQERTDSTTAKGQAFFNGPNTRLVSWRMSPRDGERVGHEEDVLHLHLGPVGWYDFEGLNGAFRAHPETHRPEDSYEYYIGLSYLLDDGSVEHSKLSNIFDNAVTLISNDGYVGYQRRGANVSLGNGAFTSAVAENTNRFLDDARPDDPLRRFNRQGSWRDAPADYEPRGVPHPVAAILRGIEEEVSPVVLAAVDLHSLYVTGIAFDLEGLHPTLLSIALVNLSREEILTAAAETPGIHFREGSPGFVPASFDDDDVKELLRQPNWIPTGQASLMRAIEVLQATMRERRMNLPRVIAHLRSRGRD